MISDELLDTICGVERKTVDAETASKAMRDAMRSAEEVIRRYRAGLFLATMVSDRGSVVALWGDPRNEIKPIERSGPLLNGC